MGILLISCVEEENIESVAVGIREFPVSKLVLVAKEDKKALCDLIKEKVSFLKIPLEVRWIGKDIIKDYLEVVSGIVRENSLQYDDIYMNLGGGGRLTTCAALSASFVNGVRAFDVMGDEIVFLPVLKFSYSEIVSEPKFRILEAIRDSGGVIDSLSALGEVTGMEVALLSYHIRGSRESQGLEKLGLVEVDRKEQGRLKIQLTPMGNLMLVGRKSTGPA